MSEQKGRIDTMVADVVARLEATDTLSGIAIATERKGDIEQQIAQALASLQGGVAILVAPPKLENSNPNLPGPTFDDVRLAVFVFENVLVNMAEQGRQIPGSELAERVARALHHSPLSSGKLFLCTSIGPSPVDFQTDDVVYQVMFRTRMVL